MSRVVLYVFLPSGSHTLTFIAEEKAANNIMIALHGKRVQGEVVCAGWLGDGLLRLDTAPHAGEDDTSAHMTDDIRVMKARRVDVSENNCTSVTHTSSHAVAQTPNLVHHAPVLQSDPVPRPHSCFVCTRLGPFA